MILSEVLKKFAGYDKFRIRVIIKKTEYIASFESRCSWADEKGSSWIYESWSIGSSFPLWQITWLQKWLHNNRFRSIWWLVKYISFWNAQIAQIFLKERKNKISCNYLGYDSTCFMTENYSEMWIAEEIRGMEHIIILDVMWNDAPQMWSSVNNMQLWSSLPYCTDL